VAALPNGTTATTQTPGDSTAKLATDAFVTNAVASSGASATPWGKISTTTYTGNASQTGSFPATTAAGNYLFCGGLQIQAAGSAGQVALLFSAVNGGHSVNVQAGVNTSVSTPWVQTTGCAPIHVDSGDTVGWSLTSYSIAGSPTIQYWATMQYLGP
jgi:hypothetical protein